MRIPAGSTWKGTSNTSDAPDTGCANSTGNGAKLGSYCGDGSNIVSADDMVMTASGHPANVSALIYMGSATDAIPLVTAFAVLAPASAASPWESVTRAATWSSALASSPPAKARPLVVRSALATPATSRPDPATTPAPAALASTPATVCP